MNPLYLGSQQRRLFSIYDAAAGGGRTRAAVLCYPWGAEYIYAHRSMRQLAARLSMAGFHTLRFDFFGTGDSGGEFSQADLAGWVTDAEAAIEAVADIAGVKQVALIGLRLGANIAARVAAAHPDRCNALILWDPIASGEEYVRLLHARADAPAGSEAGYMEVDGFELTHAMSNDLKRLDLHSAMQPAFVRSLALVTEPQDGQQVSCKLPATEVLPGASPWLESVMTTGEIPANVIKRIVEWLN